VATVNLTGLVEAATSECLLRMALWNAAHGFTNVEYFTQPAQLVEAGRDAVCAHALKHDYDWLLMIDGDATFPEDALARILYTAYVRVPDSDAVGAYAQLKGSYVPTIDTGTGTWEPWFPGEGPVRCIRTGGHFLLVKTGALRRFGPPWFRTRRTLRPIDALREVDNYARIKLGGENPLAKVHTWRILLQAAKQESGAEPSIVGEDSGFCDQLLAAGGKLYVDTDLVTGHIERRVITPADLKSRLEDRERKLRLACGILS